MSDNTTLNPGAAGDVIATEDIGAYKLPVSKIRLGAKDVDGGDVTASNPMPVTVYAASGGTTATPGIDTSSGQSRQMVTDLSLLDALEETNGLLRALVRGLSLQLDIDLMEMTD